MIIIQYFKFQMESQNQDQRLLVIVEHMEEYLFDWCLYQYMNMKQYLSKWNSTLIITNLSKVQSYKGQHQQQNIKNLQKLKIELKQPECRLIGESILKSDSNGFLKQGPVCLLDMRAKNQLSSNEKWKTIIFGGILGDHPPRDRTSPLRQCVSEMRHLGELQLATDTAVLVSRLILRNGMKLNNIPMIKQPTIKGKNSEGQNTVVQMEGFSYVSKYLNIETGQLNNEMSEKQKKKIYMHKGIQNLLLNEDLAAQKLM